MLSATQIEILNGIQKKLLHGDIGDIATETGKSRVYVSRVLSPTVDVYNEEIVSAAVGLIERRRQDNEKMLKKLQAA